MLRTAYVWTSSAAFAISAASCYTLADVLVDGTSVGTPSTYTFTNVQGNHTIAASFTLTCGRSMLLSDTSPNLTSG